MREHASFSTLELFFLWDHQPFELDEKLETSECASTHFIKELEVDQCLGRPPINHLHFNWPRHSTTGIMNAVFVREVKKARNVLRVTPRGHCGGSFPLVMAKTTVITAQLDQNRSVEVTGENYNTYYGRDADEQPYDLWSPPHEGSMMPGEVLRSFLTK
jgi:hypothetical protein